MCKKSLRKKLSSVIVKLVQIPYTSLNWSWQATEFLYEWESRKHWRSETAMKGLTARSVNVLVEVGFGNAPPRAGRAEEGSAEGGA